MWRWGWNDETEIPTRTQRWRRVDFRHYPDYVEWHVLHHEAYRRSAGVCERCQRWPVRDLHHLTYERYGHERLEDVLFVCGSCHEALTRAPGAPTRADITPPVPDPPGLPPLPDDWARRLNVWLRSQPPRDDRESVRQYLWRLRGDEQCPPWIAARIHRAIPQ